MNIVVQWVVASTYEQQRHAVQVGFRKVTFLPTERQGLDASAHLWGNDSDALRVPTEYRCLVRSHPATTDNEDSCVADAYVNGQELQLLSYLFTVLPFYLFNQYFPVVADFLRREHLMTLLPDASRDVLNRLPVV